MKKATFPPPTKWEFYEEECITCLGTSHEKEIGTVWIVGRNFLTISFAMGDKIDIPWANARKLRLTSDFVHISTGCHQGRSGWVVGIESYELFFTEEVLQSPEFKTVAAKVHF